MISSVVVSYKVRPEAVVEHVRLNRGGIRAIAG
jgi:hypothetical protein